MYLKNNFFEYLILFNQGRNGQLAYSFGLEFLKIFFLNKLLFKKNEIIFTSGKFNLIFIRFQIIYF